MSNVTNISAFLKQNKKTRENTKFAATKSLLDADGNPLKWEIRTISAKENDALQEKCILEVPVPGKPNQYRQKVDSTKYAKKLVVASVVFPDLLNAELQDSYGVKTPEDLVQEMVDSAGEWNALFQFVNQLNGFTTLDEDIEKAKN